MKSRYTCTYMYNFVHIKCQVYSNNDVLLLYIDYTRTSCTCEADTRGQSSNQTWYVGYIELLAKCEAVLSEIKVYMYIHV